MNVNDRQDETAAATPVDPELAVRQPDDSDEPGTAPEKARLTLRMLLVGVLAAVALLPLGLFWTWSQSAAFDQQMEDVTDRHLLLARNLGDALTRYRRDVLSAFELLSDQAAGEHALAGSSAMMSNLAIRCICVAQPDGTVIHTMRAENETCPEFIPPERMAALAATAEGEAPVLSNVMADPHGRPTIYIVRYQGENLIIGTISTDYFVELGKSISFGHRGHAAIVDAAGQVLAHPKTEWQDSMKDLSQVAPVAAMMAGETGISQFYSPAMLDDMIAGFTTVPGTGWGVMIPQPIGELRAAASSASRSAILLLAVSLIIAAAIGWILAVRLTAPLKSVVEAARQMAQGDVSARVKDTKGRLVIHEFASLQRMFNAMAASVQRAKIREQHASEMAMAANQSKSMFLANTSHELRTPLNAIIGFTDVMDSEIFGRIEQPKYRGYVTDIKNSAEHLRRLINDVLDISSFDLDKIALMENEVAVASVLHEVNAMTRQSADAKGIALEFDLPSEWHVHSDPSRMSQVLINLINNAVRHTPSGGRIDVRVQGKADGRLALSVTDNGSGIAADELAAVLEPFRRGELAMIRSNDGVGLGLAIVGAIARAHGADFTLESELGRGTVATLTLPAERVFLSKRAAA